ncbi:hypothetical protein CA13_03270 [Planctomycetes bacterium CA13]|uniref:Uncharacterized protein n=1 Tax=Novipirellula herctigrandis TaxID=2527986 RepID=A0A5C5YVR4_9BACT|nr:hypothetical protein CA13_03270 [Planctomycetes bacterium CA13]
MVGELIGGLTCEVSASAKFAPRQGLGHDRGLATFQTDRVCGKNFLGKLVTLWSASRLVY